ncbi:MAG TPA: hypothetical protein VH912_30125 [Streptosporangiaceae bacterium]
MRGRTWIKIVVVVAGVAVGAGLFFLGRLTAHGYDDGVRDGRAAGLRDGRSAGLRDGTAAGLREGRAQGRAEGRALQVAQAAPATSRDAVAAAFRKGYAAGANDVFAGYDGGWGLAAPYVIALSRGSGPVTYRIDSRTPMHAGVNYYLCPGSRTLCQEPRR